MIRTVTEACSLLRDMWSRGEPKPIEVVEDYRTATAVSGTEKPLEVPERQRLAQGQMQAQSANYLQQLSQQMMAQGQSHGWTYGATTLTVYDKNHATPLYTQQVSPNQWLVQAAETPTMQVSLNHLPPSSSERERIIHILHQQALAQGNQKEADYWHDMLTTLTMQAIRDQSLYEREPKKAEPPKPKPPKTLEERIQIYNQLVEGIDKMEKKLKVRTEPQTDDLLDSLAERLQVLETKLSQLEKSEKKEPSHAPIDV